MGGDGVSGGRCSGSEWPPAGVLSSSEGDVSLTSGVEEGSSGSRFGTPWPWLGAKCCVEGRHSTGIIFKVFWPRRDWWLTSCSWTSGWKAAPPGGPSWRALRETSGWCRCVGRSSRLSKNGECLWMTCGTWDSGTSSGLMTWRFTSWAKTSSSPLTSQISTSMSSSSSLFITSISSQLSSSSSSVLWDSLSTCLSRDISGPPSPKVCMSYCMRSSVLLQTSTHSRPPAMGRGPLGLSNLPCPLVWTKGLKGNNTSPVAISESLYAAPLVQIRSLELLNTCPMWPLCVMTLGSRKLTKLPNTLPLSSSHVLSMAISVWCTSASVVVWPSQLRDFRRKARGISIKKGFP